MKGVGILLLCMVLIGVTKSFSTDVTVHSKHQTELTSTDNNDSLELTKGELKINKTSVIGGKSLYPLILLGLWVFIGGFITVRLKQYNNKA